MNKDNEIKSIEIWPSVARLIAISMIFVFHWLRLLERYHYRLDFKAILIFCFLSGYLINLSSGTQKFTWFIRRYFSIMVPYWLVVIPIIIANQLFQYKPATIISTMVTILGGNLFLSNPVMVTAWYITFVLLLYLYALLKSFCSSLLQIVLMIVGLFSFYFLFHMDMVYYFIAFIAGLYLAPWSTVWRMKNRSYAYRSSAAVLFRIQRYCYSFFLIHGLVCLVFYKMTTFPVGEKFILSFLLSAFLSFFLYTIARPLESIAVDKLLKLAG
jgi:hypothetical protein